MIGRRWLEAMDDRKAPSDTYQAMRAVYEAVDSLAVRVDGLERMEMAGGPPMKMVPLHNFVNMEALASPMGYRTRCACDNYTGYGKTASEAMLDWAKHMKDVGAL